MQELTICMSASLEAVVASLLIEQNLSISVAESCSGGLLAGRLINYPGISKVFKEGFITSKLRSRLGKFEDAKNLDLDLQITRKTENPKFEIGSFSLAGPEIMLEAFITGNNTIFAVINVLTIQEYEALKYLGKIHELKDKFVLQSNSENKLIIEKAEDRKEFDIDVTGNYKTGSQLLEGYALFHLMEVNSNEVFSIRLDFSLINDIRLRIY